MPVTSIPSILESHTALTIVEMAVSFLLGLAIGLCICRPLY